MNAPKERVSFEYAMAINQKLQDIFPKILKKNPVVFEKQNKFLEAYQSPTE